MANEIKGMRVCGPMVCPPSHFGPFVQAFSCEDTQLFPSPLVGEGRVRGTLSLASSFSLLFVPSVSTYSWALPAEQIADAAWVAAGHVFDIFLSVLVAVPFALTPQPLNPELQIGEEHRRWLEQSRGATFDFVMTRNPLSDVATDSTADAVAKADLPAANGGSFAAAPPPEEDPKNKKDRVSDGRWWKPWRVPAEVETEMHKAFETDEDLGTQTRKSAEIFLRFRIDQIPDPARREAALALMERSFNSSSLRGREIRTMDDVNGMIEGIFTKLPEPIRGHTPRTTGGFAKGLVESFRTGHRPFASLGEQAATQRGLQDLRSAMNTSGSLFPGGDLWVHPEIREMPNKVGTVNVLAHELGGHLAAREGASGFSAALPIRLMFNPVVKLLDPLPPVTRPALTFVVEGEAIGTEWEWLHRLPENVRARHMDAIRQSLGENADLLQHDNAVSRTRAMRGRFPEDADLGVKRNLTMRIMEYKNLEAASLPKGEYIASRRANVGYTPTQLLFDPTNAARERARLDDMLPSYYTAKGIVALKLALETGAAIYFLSRKDHKD